MSRSWGEARLPYFRRALRFFNAIGEQSYRPLTGLAAAAKSSRAHYSDAAPPHQGNGGIFALMLLNVAENPLELVQAVVAHDQLAPARRSVLKRDLGAQLIGQLALQALNIRVRRRRLLRFGRGWVDDATHQGLGFAH